MYGITETTVHVTYRPLASDDLQRRSSPIGAAIPDLRLYLLDRRMRPTPLGAPGALFVTGPGLARGYIGRPDLTASRFTPDPFSGEPGTRCYASGDLAKRLDDGDLIYLGRADDQLKLRGFRIEPGEIESVIRAHPEIRAAAVLALGRAETRSLVGFAVARGDEAPSIRDFLAARLPSHMIPARIVMLDALPLNANGKLDRAALARLAEEAGPVTLQAEAPLKTATEKILASIWTDLLAVEVSDRHANFFELGGHSLSATRLLARIEARLAVSLTVRDVFTNPEAAALAALIERRLGDRSVASLRLEAIPSETNGDRGYPLSFSQQRLWFLDRMEGANPVYNIATPLAVTGNLDVLALDRARVSLLQRHEGLRTIFAADDRDNPRQIVLETGAVPLTLLDLADVPDREILASALQSAESKRPFDLARGPLLRLTCLRLGERRFLILVTMHHMITDAWSIAILVRELAASYRAALTGDSPDLGPLPIRYVDFAYWQRQWLASETLARQLAYWRENLTGAPPLLALPTDRPRPKVQTFNGKVLHATLSPSTRDRMIQLGARRGATPFMTFLAVYQILLAKYTDSRDIVVGAPIANRTRAELENLIGLFVNTLALRAHVRDNEPVSCFLTRARDTALDAFAHQEIPFECVVDALQPERALGHAPIFQVFSRSRTRRSSN